MSEFLNTFDKVDPNKFRFVTRRSSDPLYAACRVLNRAELALLKVATEFAPFVGAYRVYEQEISPTVLLVASPMILGLYALCVKAQAEVTETVLPDGSTTRQKSRERFLAFCNPFRL